MSLYALLVAANIAAWIWAWTLFANQPTLFGAAVLAYTFGLRHAIDADHIAAIDNVVRKLMQEGKQPFAVGFYFSLGHSTVVVLAVVVIALTATAIQDQFASFMSVGGTIGTSVSAAFLLTIGVANLFILRSVWRTFSRVQGAEDLRLDHPDLFATGQGVLSRVFGPMLRAVSSPWRMYPLGFLFGLGFDTATEISLLSISAAGSGPMDIHLTGRQRRRTRCSPFLKSAMVKPPSPPATRCGNTFRQRRSPAAQAATDCAQREQRRAALRFWCRGSKKVPAEQSA
jgi:nickel/cobalt transporter (NiCoT) family protein